MRALIAELPNSETDSGHLGTKCAVEASVDGTNTPLAAHRSEGQSRRTGLIHGLLNIGAISLYATAFILRKRSARSKGQPCALAGYAI